jgi:hypothetical protein
VRERWTVRWFRKRALLYHLFVIILVPGCLLAGWWQINRAESGNTLSYLYSVEWPIFAIMSFVGWWQLIHEDPADVDARKIERARRAATRGPFVPPPPEAESGFYHPLQPGAYGTLGSAGGAGGLVRREGPAGGEIDELEPGGEGRPIEVHALSSYNAYLARLSAGGGRKSWRNPHGITAATVRSDPPPVVRGPDRPGLDSDPGRSLADGVPAPIRLSAATGRPTSPGESKAWEVPAASDGPDPSGRVLPRSDHPTNGSRHADRISADVPPAGDS